MHCNLDYTWRLKWSSESQSNNSRHQSSRSAWILVTFLLYLLMAIKDKHCTTILYYFLPTLVEHLGHKCDLPVGNDFSLFFIFVILLSLFSKRFTITPRNPSYLLKNEGEKDENNCTGFHFSVPFLLLHCLQRKIEHNFWLFISFLDLTCKNPEAIICFCL